MYYSDTNNDHGCNWSDSFVGKAWLAQGEVMWQERLILPGYETRERYHPAGAPPYLMCNNKKHKGNQGGGKGSNPNQGNQNHGSGNRGNQNQGNQNQTTRTATKGTAALGVTKVVAEGTKERTLEGVDTTRPKGITTRALAQQTNKVHMIMMSIPLISLT